MPLRRVNSTVYNNVATMTAVAELNPTMVSLFHPSEENSYDERDDESYVLADSETEVSQVSDDDMTEDYETLIFLNMDEIDSDSHYLLREQTDSLLENLDNSLKVLIRDVDEAANGFVAFLVKHEIPRKVFHSVLGFVALALFKQGWSQYEAAKVVWILFVLVFANDLIRLRIPRVNKAVLPFVRLFMRKHEALLWNGIVFYLAGAGLVLSFAAKDIALMSIVLLSWADTAASTVGRTFGKYTPEVGRGKSIAGCLASAFTGLCACYLFYGYFVLEYPWVNGPGELLWTPETSQLNIHALALLTGVITSFSEASDIALLDDNFTIPVLCSLGLTAVVQAARIAPSFN